MTCDDFKVAVLSEAGASDVQAHSAGCAACRAFAEGVERDARLLRAVAAPAPSAPALPAGLWERLERRMAPPRPVRRLIPLRAAAAASVAALIFAAALWTSRPQAPPVARRRAVQVIDARARDPRVEQRYNRDFAGQGGAEALAVVATEEEGE